MTDEKLIEAAFKAHEGAPTWDDDPVGRDSAIRWHMRGFNDARAVFEKAHAPTGCFECHRADGQHKLGCGQRRTPTDDYPDAEGLHALRAAYEAKGEGR